DGGRDAARGRGGTARVPGRADAAPRDRRDLQSNHRNDRLTGSAGRSAREAALSVLSAVRAGTPFAAALDAAICPLADLDRPLAHEIAAGVLRARRRLDGRLRPLVTGEWRRVDPTLRDVLRIGAYQLAFLERVPAYAAVETAVDLARRST